MNFKPSNPAISGRSRTNSCAAATPQDRRRSRGRVRTATSPATTAESKAASKRKPCSARTSVASVICATVFALDTGSGPNRHRLADEPRQHKAGNDHDVARHHEDDQRDRQGAGDPERHIDRYDQRLVGQRIEIGAELARHVKALGEEAVDGVADPGHQEQRKGRQHIPRRDRPDDDRHQDYAGQCDEIWNTQNAPRLPPGAALRTQGCPRFGRSRHPARKQPARARHPYLPQYSIGAASLRVRRFPRRRRRHPFRLRKGPLPIGGFQ